MSIDSTLDLPLAGARRILVVDDVGVVRKAAFRLLSEAGGVALARLIREEWPAVRVLFMSAYPAEILVREGLDHPNVFFLAKPFTRSELLGKVVGAMRAHPEHDGKASRASHPSS